MDKKIDAYKELECLIEAFSISYDSKGELTMCFDLIKKIIDGEISKDDLSEEEKKKAQRQFIETEEFLQCVFMNMPMVIVNRDELWEYIK